MSAALPVLAALRGMRGIGKSALAREVGRELGWPLLDKDDIKAVVYGRTQVADEVSYDLLFRLARRQLQQGLNVLVDSPLMHRGLYELASRTAREAGGRLVVLDCVLTDESEHRRRLDGRATNNPPPEWAIREWAAYIDYRDRALPRSDYVIDVLHQVIDLSQPIPVAALQAVSWLRRILFIPCSPG